MSPLSQLHVVLKHSATEQNNLSKSNQMTLCASEDKCG